MLPGDLLASGVIEPAKARAEIPGNTIFPERTPSLSDPTSLALEPELICTLIRIEYSDTGPISKFPKEALIN